MKRLALTMILFLELGGSANAQMVFEAYDFCYTRGRDLGQQLAKGLSSDELKYAAVAVCAAYGVDCSNQAQAVQTGAKVYSQITEPRGDESNGIIRVPPQYDVCYAVLDYGKASITSNTVFNTTIMRSGNDNGLGYTVYAKTHGGVAPPREWVNARIYLMLVPNGTRGQYSCPPLPSRAWNCKGRSCEYLVGGRGSNTVPVNAPVFNGCTK